MTFSHPDVVETNAPEEHDENEEQEGKSEEISDVNSTYNT